MRPAEENRKETNIMGVDVAIKAEDSPTSCSSSSSNTQYSSNRRSSSDMAAGVKHSSTGARRHIIRITVIRKECVTDVEGQDLSTQNTRKSLYLLLTSQLF